MNHCYCRCPFKCHYTFYSCTREPACSAAAAYNRGCYSAYFGILWLQPSPSMHQPLPYSKQCKHAKSSFKLQFWQSSHCTGFTSTIFNLPPSPLLVSSHHLTLPACLCFSCIVLSPLKGHNSGLSMQPLICSGPLGLCPLCMFMCIFSTC